MNVLIVYFPTAIDVAQHLAAMAQQHLVAAAAMIGHQVSLLAQLPRAPPVTAELVMTILTLACAASQQALIMKQ